MAEPEAGPVAARKEGSDSNGTTPPPPLPLLLLFLLLPPPPEPLLLLRNYFFAAVLISYRLAWERECRSRTVTEIRPEHFTRSTRRCRRFSCLTEWRSARFFSLTKSERFLSGLAFKCSLILPHLLTRLRNGFILCNARVQ